MSLAFVACGSGLKFYGPGIWPMAQAPKLPGHRLKNKSNPVRIQGVLPLHLKHCQRDTSPTSPCNMDTPSVCTGPWALQLALIFLNTCSVGNLVHLFPHFQANNCIRPGLDCAECSACCHSPCTCHSPLVFYFTLICLNTYSMGTFLSTFPS